MIINDVSLLLDELYRINMEYSRNFYSPIDDLALRSIYQYRLKDLENSNVANNIIYEYVLQLNRDVSKKVLNLKMRYCDYDLEYRFKSIDTVKEKIGLYNSKGTYYVGKLLNDLCGIRIIINDFDSNWDFFEKLFLSKASKFAKFKYRQVNKETYKATHCYFGVHSNTFPWELQIWDSNNKIGNKNSHYGYEIERRKNIGGMDYDAPANCFKS